MTTRNTKQDGSRTYEVPNPNGEGTLTLPSVTTVLRVMDKPGLLWWAAGEAADYALDNLDILQAMLNKGDREKAWKLVRGAFREEKAMKLGSEVHDTIEQMTLTPDEKVEVSPKAQPYVKAWADFVDSYKGEFYATEMTVFNVTVGYAGTLDALWQVPTGEIGTLDYKTRQNKKVADVKSYNNEWLQVTAYSKAEYAVVGGEIVPMPEISGASVVMLCADGFRVDKVTPEKHWEGFIAAKGLFDWMEGV